MAMVIPCIRAKMGNTEYYQTTMLAGELVRGTRAASDLDEWTTMGIEERMQRELDKKRIREQLAPYIARSEDRFWGSIIVLVYHGSVHFENLKTISTRIPAAYAMVAEDLGFLTIDGGSLIVLDGQHRMAAMRNVIEGETDGPYAKDVKDDKISVIFINHETLIKTRRIFNKVNRYAKTTSRGDNIITSEDDGYAIVARLLLERDAPLGRRDDSNGVMFVNWVSNTLSARSSKLTTISVVAETVKLILAGENIGPLTEQLRPSDDEIAQYFELADRAWATVLEKVEPYKIALAHPERISEMREDTAPYSLLFKPVAQIAFFKALVYISANYDLTLEEAAIRANKIDWSMTSPIWKDIIVRPGGSIDARQVARDRLAELVIYLIAADKMTEEQIHRTYINYNEARDYNFDDPKGEEPEQLPTPVIT